MIAVIIQARFGSTRLPGKVLKKINGKTLLEILIERLRHCASVKDIIIATTDNPKDEKIVALAKKLKVPFFRGSEHDVLDRFYQAACKFNVDDIVRVTSDCPLMDPAIVDGVVSFYKKNKEHLDYASNVDPPTFPDGMDVEVFSFGALERIWRQAKLPSDREHVTAHMRHRPGEFKMDNLRNGIDFSTIRLTVDEPEDFILIRRIFSALYPKNPTFNLEDVLNFLTKNKNLTKINAGIMRNEGYAISLKKDDTEFI